MCRPLTGALSLRTPRRVMDAGVFDLLLATRAARAAWMTRRRILLGLWFAALGADGRGYVLADRSCKLSPAGWARQAVDAYHEFKADRLIAERNFGGALVEHVIRTADSAQDVVPP
jgi:phage terminase large subunit-like protein